MHCCASQPSIPDEQNSSQECIRKVPDVSTVIASVPQKEHHALEAALQLNKQQYCSEQNLGDFNHSRSLDSPKFKKSNGCIPRSITVTGQPTLERVLDTIPLVYDPATRQLHLKHQQNKINLSKAHTNNGSCLSMDNGCHPTDHGVENDLCSAFHSTLHGSLVSLPRDLDSSEINNTKDNELDQDSGYKAGSHSSSGFTDEPETCWEQRLQRCPTEASLLQTDASSFTSISSVSTGTDFSVSTSEYAEALDPYSFCTQDNFSHGAKPKRRGLSSILSRGLLSWKSKANAETLSCDSFSRGPSPTPSKHSTEECVPSSTTALIFENRPLNLPAKSPEEELKHKQEYEEMVKAARKKELRDAKMRKKQIQQQRKQEDLLVQATKTWVNEILPNWESLRNSRKARYLWWQGIPPSVRGKVWKLAIGNELNITSELYEICSNKSREVFQNEIDDSSVDDNPEDGLHTRENSAHLIRLDVSRTFPQLGIFQENGPYYDILHCVLGAYVVYRPDIGYVQGMSFLAAMLLLNLDVMEAFISFANLLNRPCQLAFFRVDEPQMNVYYSVYEEFFRENLPKLYNHFKKNNLTPDLYLVDWIYTLFSRSLPLDVACRVWDIFFRDGEEFLFRSALGILRMYEDILVHMDFIHLAQFLTKLPEDMNPELLFNAISAIHMTINKKNFSHTLAKHRESVVT